MTRPARSTVALKGSPGLTRFMAYDVADDDELLAADGGRLCATPQPRGLRVTTKPPELPVLMTASVWKSSATITWSPTLTVSELAIRAGWAPGDRSAPGSEAMIFAAEVCPP
jgi:hypothetical protein